MQSKAFEWKFIPGAPKITPAEADGRDQIIDDETEDRIQLEHFPQ